MAAHLTRSDVKGRKNCCISNVVDGMLVLSVRERKALTVKMETVTLSDEGRQHALCIKCMKLIENSFLIRRFIFGGLS